MLHDRAPEIDFAVDTASLVAKLAQVLKVLRRVHAAGAVGLRNLVGGIRFPGPAFRRQRLARRPWLAVERPQPGGIPTPDALADDRRNEIGDFHGAAGTCSGSGSGDWIGSGSRVGSFTGSSSGSTTMVRNGSPICIHFLPRFILVPGMQGTVACSEAARRVKNCSQMRHLRTPRLTRMNTLPTSSVRAEPAPR